MARQIRMLDSEMQVKTTRMSSIAVFCELAY